jgi:hypothetical protein
VTAVGSPPWKAARSTTLNRLPRMLARPRNQLRVSGTGAIAGTGITSPASSSRTSQRLTPTWTPSRADGVSAAAASFSRRTRSCWNSRRLTRRAMARYLGSVLYFAAESCWILASSCEASTGFTR